jgi:osmotically-inducible protein OsmY
MNDRIVTGLALGFLVLAPLGACTSPSRTTATAGDYIDDTAITSKVKAALLGDAGLQSFEIGVETFKGTVQLSGFVGSAPVKQRAGQVAGGVAGVREVRNNLVIK